ncbi:Brix-domain-containing protein [Cutaneotrichosporon oleaginosum]|uniref:Brix-domain-containing protein n=1 Tax=Cutaneotrichosporon oleaginosum TaxID=879819 RepID=A0A0J0XLD7_9TREE|nr:Brix-domain-containing protein [Cutaneotrichosporon oleaginosum]KLT41898.1 Brix-domain-containing protein [Cutaneotrichosporon oleaginosum]TXT12498.1 hypothetical protein COLE_02908 [Cutaneotrichosporon oleaginosum]
MGRDKKIANAVKRGQVFNKTRREKAQDKLKRRMEQRKLETAEGGDEIRRERLEKNIPRTIDNTRIYDGTSYLTADPATLRAAEERAAEASRLVNAPAEPMDEDEESDDEDEDESKAGPSGSQAEAADEDGDEDDDDDKEAEEETEQKQKEPEPVHSAPPRILITTSPGPSKPTYHFCDDLKSIFPGGEFFKRPKGRGFELGRVARWSAKRGYSAVIVINEDHKKPNALTLINLPAGPTAYFKLSSVQLGSEIHGHGRATAHNPELILNGFTTLLGNSVGGMWAQLFPPMPQFRGRQVATLHNQRDFLFFRRHRYAFTSPTSAKLQEIGPRFTLKLRWLRKGLPSVRAGDGRMPTGGDKSADDEFVIDDDEETAEQERKDEEEAAAAMNNGEATPSGQPIPALDEEQEYEWKWKPKMEVSRRTFFL